MALIMHMNWTHSQLNSFDVLQATVGNQQRFYIAAQGPLPGTVGSFWQMIWEADVYLVVMLTGAQEEGSVVYCPELADMCVEVGEVSYHCFHYRIWLTVPYSVPSVGTHVQQLVRQKTA
jgi:hypothetical protein